MEALTRWLRALIFTPGDSPATGAQEGNRTERLGQVASEDASAFTALFAGTLLRHRAYVGTPREGRTPLPWRDR